MNYNIANVASSITISRNVDSMLKKRVHCPLNLCLQTLQFNIQRISNVNYIYIIYILYFKKN